MRTFSIPLNFSHSHRLTSSPNVKIPKEIEIPVFLIRHELQSRMLFKHLQAIGFEGCYFENFLDRLILASLRMWDATDETFKIYFDLMQKWTNNISTNDDVITRRALLICAALVKARNRRMIKIPGNKKAKNKSTK